MIDLEEFKKMRNESTIPEKIKQVEEIIDFHLKKLAHTPERDSDSRFNLRSFYLAELKTSHSAKAGILTELGRKMSAIDPDLRSIVRKNIVSMYSSSGYEITWEKEGVGFEQRAFVIRIKNI